MELCNADCENIWILIAELYKNGRRTLFVPQTFVSKSKDKLVEKMKSIQQAKYDEIKQDKYIELCGTELDPNNDFVYIEYYDRKDGLKYELRCNIYDAPIII